MGEIVTIIATDGRQMAADSQAESVYLTTSERKIHLLTPCATHGLSESRVLLAGAGVRSVVHWLRLWVKDPSISRPEPITPLTVDDWSEILVLGESGRVWRVASDMLLWEREEAPQAIGSGCRYVIGALDAGATLQAAMAIALSRDKGSGGEIHVMGFDQ